MLYKGRNIAQILDMTVEQAHAFFSAVPTLHRKLQTLLDQPHQHVEQLPHVLEVQAGGRLVEDI